MLKRFSVALAALFVLATQCFAAGTIPYSLSQQFDKFGHVLAGCKLNIIQAGTGGTPQVAYQDTALTLPVPGGSQLTCDAAGRLPQFFLADGNIKIQLTDVNGVLQITADNILVIGNSSGGGGGSPVDPTTILQTGDIKSVYGTGVITGFVRLNGRTIGSASSGATERANADTQALFQYLWGVDSTLTVSTGRGVSANADWVANKQLSLPDARGRALAGLNDMGNSNASIISPLPANIQKGDTITLGSLMGIGTPFTMAMTNLPASPAPITATYSPIITSGGTGAVGIGSGTASTAVVGYAGAGTPIQIYQAAFFGAIGGFTSLSNTAALGSATPYDTLSPLMLITLYQKL